MADEQQEQKQEQEQRPEWHWDYSSHPLKEGGMQIAITVIGSVIVLMVTAVIVIVWLLMR